MLIVGADAVQVRGFMASQPPANDEHEWSYREQTRTGLGGMSTPSDFTSYAAEVAVRTDDYDTVGHLTVPGERCVARAEAVHVCFDVGKRVAVPVWTELLAAIEARQGAPLPLAASGPPAAG